MANYKHELITDIQVRMAKYLDEETLVTLGNVLGVALKDYDVLEKCTTLALQDTKTEKLVKRFLATKKLEGRTDKTLKHYALILTNMLKTINVPIDEIDTDMLRAYLSNRALQGISARTLNGNRSVICSCFNWLFSEGEIKNNPCSSLGVIKYGKKVKMPFSKVEIELLKENCTNTRNRALIEFMLSTGCRISEVCALNRTDVDFSNLECTVLGKGNKERVVFLDPVASLWLQKYLMGRKDNEPELFHTSRKGRIEPNTVRFMLKSLSKITHIENVHPHRFRRTMATNMINRGMPIQEVAQILGHDNINTTMEYVYVNKNKTKSTYANCVA